MNPSQDKKEPRHETISLTAVHIQSTQNFQNVTGTKILLSYLKRETVRKKSQNTTVSPFFTHRGASDTHMCSSPRQNYQNVLYFLARDSDLWSLPVVTV